MTQTFRDGQSAAFAVINFYVDDDSIGTVRPVIKSIREQKAMLSALNIESQWHDGFLNVLDHYKDRALLEGMESGNGNDQA
jgi:hypothetical protein